MRNYQLIDASDVRPGFRVFRIRATRLEFKFANGKRTDIEDNSGKNYVIESPGRYVVVTGSGCRRVSDAQIADCLRPMRPHDKYVELLFEANPTWRNCFATFCMEGEHDLDWHKQPMELRSEPGVWFLRIEAKHGVKCAFTDGGSEWDSNSNLNYQIKLPGKYLIGKRHIVYLGVSDLDIHLDKSWNTDALKP